ncbi:hypothetical protein FRZ03_38640 [Streptomyces misionensis]|uniref:Uncharacterized protein n=1 Tax=Streptomyces misionensis TaxID=67331 RepID=A0A5C6I932_9ACTN|nr:hypothetical protein FRZ03_38640 [Streptomyces misionensis]
MNTEALKAEAVTSEPVTGAGFDPAFIPGITAPASPSEPKSSPEQESEPEADAASAEQTTADEAGASDAAAEDAPSSPDDASADAPSDGPVFEAADRRARIVADHKGVRLSLDEESCEFGWDEIAAVESETPRFGKRYTITVHTPERRWYPIEIEAPSRSRFKEWDEQLDAVLDAFFEDAD